MSLNLPLPDWVPWWVQLALLILAILFGFAFLMMPFAVFGLKGRLDFLETQLDDIHAELRMVATRLPDPERAPDRVSAREPVFEQLSTPPVRPREPSPTRFAAPPPAPVAFARPVPEAPVAATRSPFRDDAAPQPAMPPRRPSRADDWTPADPDDAEDGFARRPLRATTLRDPARDRGRSEPTLRWPPPR